MLCTKCRQNEATVHVKIQRNNYKQEEHLCASCYQEIKNEITIPFDPMDSLFNSFFKGGFSTPLSLSMNPQDSLDGMDSYPDQSMKNESGFINPASARKEKGVLANFGRNLTQMAKDHLIDPVIGRDKELDQVIEVLNRRNKNNPVLIGEPGVGKTAIAEGLALRISEGKVPDKLKNKEVISLDVASLVSGTSYRGQFEERMKQLIQELENKKDVILFIDEIHQLVGAGKAEGSMDAGNILKPALARGELQVIGATTLKEYREIEKDGALERRFQPIMVNEPTVEDTIEILKGLRPKYEAYHQVQYPDEVIEACVKLSHRYIQDRHLPDKAIDLMDEAGSRVNLKDSMDDIDRISQRLKEIAEEKRVAAEKEEYEKAALLRQEELQLEEKRAKLEKEGKGQNKGVVTVEVIQQIVENKTGIPVRKLQMAEQQKLKNLAENLGKKVIGQDEAVQKVAKAIRRSRAGMRDGRRPIASFLFVGPTGVGKTELTKCLAEELFGDRDAMIRLDMSEFMEKHSVSKLIGAPPGYIGYDEAGQLTEQVRRHPYSIILLDEMEKAHPDVQNMFLQVLEDGQLTDSQGRKVSFKDTVVIMTSNADFVEAHFRPEFLNRLDGIITFNALGKEVLVSIVELMLEQVNERLKQNQMSMEVTLAAKEKLAELRYDPKFGARPLRRVIQEKVEDAIVDLILDDEAKEVLVDVENGEIVVRKKA